VSKPAVKKNPDGTWTITGVQENRLTQNQADYQQLVKASELLTGEEGERARSLITQTPTLSGGLLASLASYGAVPNNNLVKTLADIDAQTRAQRELDAFAEAQRISNEKFNSKWYGKLWSTVKGLTRFGTIIGETPGELVQASARTLKEDIDAAVRGDINFWTRQPTDPTKTREDLGLSSGPGSVLNQLKVTQIAKELVAEKKIDLGAGFFPSEETGAGFAARKAQMDVAAVNVKVGNRTYQRPFYLADPVVNAITFGNADTSYGNVMVALGNLAFAIKTDTFIVYSRIKRAANEAERVARTSTGVKAAKAYQQKAILDAEIDELTARINQSSRELDNLVGPERAAKQDEFVAALNERVQKSDEYDNIVYDPEAVAGFLSSSAAAPAIDALSEITDWKEIWRLGKSAGGRNGFNVEQAKAIAAASNREEVLSALAPYIAKGTVAAGVLDRGTATGKAVGEMLSSRIVPGQVAQIVDSIKGLGARGFRKMPFYNKVVTAYNKGLTVVPRGKAIHASDKDGLIDAIYSYGRITNVSAAKLDELADIVALTDDASEAGYTASARLFDEILAANIDKKYINPELLKEVTRIFRSGKDQMSTYWSARHAAGAKIDYVLSGNKKVTITGPHLDSEYLNSVVYLPDARELLDVISSVNKFGKVTENTKELTDFLTNTVWKRIVLVRPAYIMRNIAEEQIRVLGTGHISFFNNPLMAMGMWLGRDGGSSWRAVLNKFDPFKNTVTDESFKLGSAKDEFVAEVAAHDATESYIKFMTAGVSGIDNDARSVMSFAGFQPRAFGHPRWWEGLANEIRILSNSIAGRAVARTGPTLDNQMATVDYLLTGAGKDEWTQFAKLQKPEIRDWLLSPEGAMTYLFTGTDGTKAVSLLARIEEAAGMGGEASQAIKNLIAFGRIDKPGFKIEVPKGRQSAENSIRNAAAMSSGKKALKDINEEFADILKQSFDGKGNWDGLLMNVPEAKFQTTGKIGEIFTRVSEGFFNFAVKLEKTSTMGPEWRQSYWDAIYDISGALDAEAVAKLGSVAKKSLTPLTTFKGQPIGKEHAVWKAFKTAEESAAKVSREELAEAQSYVNKFPNLQEYKDGGSGGIVGTRSVVGFVKTSALKDMSGNIAGNKEAIEFYRQSLREGKGFSKQFRDETYNEPIMVVYDNETGLAYIGEGNHRLQAALAEGIGYVPVRVVKGNKKEMVTDLEAGRFPKQIKNNKKPQFPETYGPNAGKVRDENYVPPEMHPSYVFDKEYTLTESVEAAKKFGNITAAEAHEYASFVASKRVADLFYDASRKRLIFHQLRLIAPFGAAWEDTIRKWGQIALDNPMEVYKIQKSLQWLTKPESSALYSLTDAKDYYDPNQGFFFNDPLDGQRKFFIPFLGTGLNFLSNLRTGQGLSKQGPYAIAATPQSLNFAFASGSIMPGFGPGLQMAVIALDELGVNPINIAPIGMRDSINKIIFPFGEPDLKQGVLEGFLPGNWRRLLAFFPGQEESYAAAFAPVMNYLASGGNYDLNDIEDQAQLMRDTDKFAKWFTVFRGLFGLVSPFPLQPQGLSTLDDGNVVLSTALYNDFKQLEVAAGGNYNKAYADFLDLYGPEAIFAIINTSSGAPTNLMTYELIQREPEVVDLYPDTYGYAYPAGGFSTELYRWQRRAGEKQKFTSQELVQRATSLRFYAADDRLMARLISGDFSEEEYEEARKNLRDTFIKAGLSQETDPYKEARTKEQLRRMATDIRFEDSDAVAGLRDYLYLRDKALEAASIDNDSLAKKGALPQREWLAGQVKQILQRNPEFYKFYYRFFKEELEG
jgi:hypothetical protein